MRALGTVLQILSVLIAAMGLLWMGQGLGLVHWPASSPMLDQKVWAFRALVPIVIGIVLGLVGRRLSSALHR